MRTLGRPLVRQGPAGAAARVYQSFMSPTRRGRPSAATLAEAPARESSRTGRYLRPGEPARHGTICRQPVGAQLST